MPKNALEEPHQKNIVVPTQMECKMLLKNAKKGLWGAQQIYIIIYNIYIIYIIYILYIYIYYIYICFLPTQMEPKAECFKKMLKGSLEGSKKNIF